MLKWKDSSGEDKVVKIKEEMSAKWMKLGQNMGISDAKLIGFKSSNNNNTDECINDVTIVWMQNSGKLKVIAQSLCVIFLWLYRSRVQ